MPDEKRGDEILPVAYDDRRGACSKCLCARRGALTSMAERLAPRFVRPSSGALEVMMVDDGR